MWKAVVLYTQHICSCSHMLYILYSLHDADMPSAESQSVSHSYSTTPHQSHIAAGLIAVDQRLANCLGRLLSLRAVFTRPSNRKTRRPQTPCLNVCVCVVSCLCLNISRGCFCICGSPIAAVLDFSEECRAFSVGWGRQKRTDTLCAITCR